MSSVDQAKLAAKAANVVLEDQKVSALIFRIFDKTSSVFDPMPVCAFDLNEAKSVVAMMYYPIAQSPSRAAQSVLQNFRAVLTHEVKGNEIIRVSSERSVSESFEVSEVPFDAL